MDHLAEERWQKSSHSAMNGCVEVALVDGRVEVRDSKNPGGPILVFTPAEWTAFVAGARDGEFDLDRLAAPLMHDPSP